MASQPTVLIVDDEPNFRLILEAKLSRSGFQVLSAADVASALERLAERQVGAILLDIRLPDMNGLAALPLLRARCPSAPAIAMTAYEEENLRRRAFLAGADAILYKPFDLEALTERLRVLVGEGARYGVVQPGQNLSIRGHGLRDLVSARVLRSWPDVFTVAVTGPLEASAGDTVETLIAGTDGLYRFDAAVVEVPSSATYALAKPVTIERFQRRAAPRAPLHVPVALRTDAMDDADSEARPGSTTDISCRGVALVADGELAIGQRASLAFSIPSGASGSTPLLVDAVVVRSGLIDEERPVMSRAGLRFERLTDDTISAIEAYVAASTPV